MWSSHSLETEEETDGYERCGYSVEKRQIPKFMGNGEISRPRLFKCWIALSTG